MEKSNRIVRGSCVCGQSTFSFTGEYSEFVRVFEPVCSSSQVVAAQPYSCAKNEGTVDRKI